MFVDYFPLLGIQREVYRVPRGPARFGSYLRSITTPGRDNLELVPMAIVNPMAREHVSEMLDTLLELQADVEASQVVTQAALALDAASGPYRASLVVADDVGGGWTNRWACESAFRFGDFDHKRPWISGVLWSSERPTLESVRETILAALLRADDRLRNGVPRTLRDKMEREGAILVQAGTTRPAIDPDEADYTREVISPFLDAEDVRITVECLFGDPAARSLGFTPRGLSPWAGLDLAIADAREAG